MAESTEDRRNENVAATGGERRFGRVAVVIAAGLLVTGLGWPGILARIPLGLMLKNELGLSPAQFSAFWAIGTIAWYVKPAFGLLCDARPIFGTRRRGYIVVGATSAALGWLAFAVVPRAYAWFLGVMVLLNLGLVLISVSVGGLMVQEGQRRGATGRLSAMFSALEGIMQFAGLLSGALAAAPFAATSLVGGAIVAAMVPVTMALLREPRAQERVDAWAAAAAELRGVARSRALWTTAGLLFLVFVTPGLQTPLFYYQQDVLKLTPRFMGLLQTSAGLGIVAGSALYAALCRRWPLRLTLTAGIVVNAAVALLFLGYRSPTSALIIETGAGLVGAMATLPLYDLAARAAPRGSEGFAFALMMAVRTIAQSAISDPLGALLYGRWHLGFDRLVLVNAGSTLAVLLFVPLLPRVLLDQREGLQSPAAVV